MRVAFLGIFDPAGSGYCYAQAISKFTPHEARAFYKHNTLPAPDNDGELGSEEERAWTEASDVVFLQLGDGIHERDKRLREALPMVTHYWNDGGPYRDHRETMWSTCADKPSVATMWMVAREYDAAWFPCCVREYVDDGSIRWRPDGHPQWPILMHMATNPTVKNTADIVAVIDALRMEKAKFLPRYEHPNSLPHREAMLKIAGADIYFDNMQGYPGVASYEASAIGIPLIVHLPPEGWGAMEAWGCEQPPPWYEAASRAELKAVVGSFRARESWEDRRRWYEQHFCNEIKAQRLVEWLEAS